MTRRGRRMRVRPGTLLPVMPSLLLLFLLGSTSALLHAPRLAPRRARTRTAAAAAAPAAEEIAAVRVCMGNLCRCQDEAAGGGAEALLAALRARAPLPYPIEEDPCLGACGQGEMVNVEYADGSASLVAGLDATLDALGLAASARAAAAVAVGAGAEAQERARSTTSSSAVAAAVADDDGVGDARERMRAAARASPPPQSGWVTLGGYLAKKAQEQFFGGDKQY